MKEPKDKRTKAYKEWKAQSEGLGDVIEKITEATGIKKVVENIFDLAGKDFRDYTTFILNNLIATPHIQKSVIIRALLNEIYSSNPDKRHAALAALNRMHDLTSDDEILTKLAQFFKDPKIEKVFLAR